VHKQTGWAFEWYVIILFGIAMYLIFGKYGTKSWDDSEPEFKTSTWLGMIFTSTSSAALIYWATIEWYYYMQSPPGGLNQFCGSFTMGSNIRMYHWGLIPTAMYVVIG
jgi:L-carnitine/gamma-butyrobetaine antiporter